MVADSPAGPTWPSTTARRWRRSYRTQSRHGFPPPERVGAPRSGEVVLAEARVDLGCATKFRECDHQRILEQAASFEIVQEDAAITWSSSGTIS